jgi:hypothetical protein
MGIDTLRELRETFTEIEDKRAEQDSGFCPD